MPWWGTVLIAVGSALLSGGFALTGVAVSDRRARAREDVAFRRQTALSLAELEPLMWGEELPALHAALTRLETSMLILGVPKEHANRLVLAHLACWYHADEMREQSGGEHAGISAPLLQAREVTLHAARELLLAAPGAATLPGAAELAATDRTLRAVPGSTSSAYVGTRVRLLPPVQEG